MSRRSYKTINLPRELVAWIDALVQDRGPVKAPHPLGIHSRDEFVRIAVAILAAALHEGPDGNTALDEVQARMANLAAEAGGDDDDRTA